MCIKSYSSPIPMLSNYVSSSFMLNSFVDTLFGTLLKQPYINVIGKSCELSKKSKDYFMCYFVIWYKIFIKEEISINDDRKPMFTIPKAI